MSTLTPNKFGGQQLVGKTGLAECRMANALAGLAWDSANFQVAGNTNPGSLAFSPSASSTDNKHGVVAVAVERHMSERSSQFDYTIQDTTRLLNELVNMSTMDQEFVQATAGWTQSTITIGSTASQISLVSTTGLTTNDKVWAVWNAGTINEREEERLVQTVVSSVRITLQRPFSAAPESTTLLRRAVDTVTIEGGGDYKQWTHNMKKTADDSSVHTLHHPNAVILNGAKVPPSNTQLMGSKLTWAANAYEYITALGESVPAFSEEHDQPRNVALGINP